MILPLLVGEKQRNTTNLELLADLCALAPLLVGEKQRNTTNLAFAPGA